MGVDCSIKDIGEAFNTGWDAAIEHTRQMLIDFFDPVYEVSKAVMETHHSGDEMPDRNALDYLMEKLNDIKRGDV